MQVVVGSPTALDLVLAVSPYADHDQNSRKAIEVFTAPIEIVPEVSVEPVDHALAEAVMNACDPRGENFNPVRQFGCPYGFFRRPATSQAIEGLSLDPDRRLYTCIALSRLIHPTAIGFEYAARIRQWINGAREIVPFIDNTINPYAFVQHTNENWLNPSDIISLASLAQTYFTHKPPARVKNALWHYEYAARAYYVDNRWLELTIALESLIHVYNEESTRGTRRCGSTCRFVKRLAGLGALDPDLAVSEADLTAMYTERSRLAHGQALGNLTPEVSALFEKLDTFVRLILRKAVREPSFASIFESASSLQRVLPLG